MTGGSRLRFHWKEPQAHRRFSTAVSLHSHTSCSKEVLDFIPRIVSGIPLLQQAEASYRRRYEQTHGHPLDYQQLWWTPPLSPAESLRIEASQIESLGLAPLVSITDHDTIDGVWGLHLLETTRQTLQSFEWTVPYGESFIHLGIHNLPSAQARSIFHQLAYYTACPDDRSLRDLLAWLHDFPDVLIVYNHPAWDEKGIGRGPHIAMMRRFLSAHDGFLHALELNGLRPWRENREVTRLALETGLPLISGGDRHGSEPNANVNLTCAPTFPDFVHQIRRKRASEVLFLPQYSHCYGLRVLDTLLDVVRTNPHHALGWIRWSDRVFRREPSGNVRPLSSYWREDTHAPTLVRCFLACAQMAASRHVRSAMRAAFPATEEMAW